ESIYSFITWFFYYPYCLGCRYSSRCLFELIFTRNYWCYIKRTVTAYGGQSLGSFARGTAYSFVMVLRYSWYLSCGKCFGSCMVQSYGSLCCTPKGGGRAPPYCWSTINGYLVCSRWFRNGISFRYFICLACSLKTFEKPRTNVYLVKCI